LRLIVSAPASSANIGPGFDSFGLALDSPRDLVEVEVNEGTGEITVELSSDSRYSVPVAPESNSGGYVARMALNRLNAGFDVHVRITKGIRPGCGLGSSGASAAAVAFALNRLLKMGLGEGELVALAAEGERAAAGSPHPDNVAASLLGGFTMIVSHSPLRVLRINPPSVLGVCVTYPIVDVERKTERMRSVVPRTVNLEDALWNTWHASAVAAGFALGDVDLIGLGMDDAIVEKARSRFVPCYSEVKRRALDAGAVGVAISGAGPAMIGFVKLGAADAQHVLREMLSAYSDAGVAAEGFLTKPGAGCLVVNASFE
jgi:homoserine kinase